MGVFSLHKIKDFQEGIAGILVKEVGVGAW
jgi:hypothetical protein